LFEGKEKDEALMAAQCWKSLEQTPFEDEYLQGDEVKTAADV
jgi:hypothetical protein